MDFIVNNYHEVLDDKVNEYEELYVLSKSISRYRDRYIGRLHYAACHYYWDSFQRNIAYHIRRLSLDIKKHIVSCDEHREKLMLVHKDIKCGLKRYLFKTKHINCQNNTTIFNKHLPSGINTYIMSFLQERDRLAIQFSSLYTDKDTLKTMLKSLTVSKIKKFPYIYQGDHKYQPYIYSRFNKLLKSYTKGQLIESLVNNFEYIYTNFRDYNLTCENFNYLQNEAIDDNYDDFCDHICGRSYYSVYYDRCYIPKQCMISYFGILYGIGIYNKQKIAKKGNKIKKSKKS